jgi:hypothetical protein
LSDLDSSSPQVPIDLRYREKRSKKEEKEEYLVRIVTVDFVSSNFDSRMSASMAHSDVR